MPYKVPEVLVFVRMAASKASGLEDELGSVAEES